MSKSRTLLVRRNQVLLIFLLYLWGISIQAQTPTESGEPMASFGDTTKNDNHKKGYNENTINQLSFLLNTQQYYWSPTEHYRIRSERIGFRLNIAIHYPDSVVSYKLNIPRLTDVTIKRDTLRGVEGYSFNLKMADSTRVEYLGSVTIYRKTINLDFFATGAKTSERLKTILQNICESNRQRWHLEAKERKSSTSGTLQEGSNGNFSPKPNDHE